jgi:hypothetical protein
LAALLVVDRVVLRVMADPMAHGAEVAGYALRYVRVIPAVAMQRHDRPTLLDGEMAVRRGEGREERLRRRGSGRGRGGCSSRGGVAALMIAC